MDSTEVNQRVNQKPLLWLMRIWWEGVKVLARYTAFGIVFGVLWLPAMGPIYLVGEHAAPVLFVAFLVLYAPIICYIASRYLHLLGEDDRDISERQDGPHPATEGCGNGMRTKAFVSMMVASFVAAIVLTPPDAISQLVTGTVPLTNAKDNLSEMRDTVSQPVMDAGKILSGMNLYSFCDSRSVGSARHFPCLRP